MIRGYPRARQEILGSRPERPEDVRIASVTFNTLVPCQHALDVAIENRPALAVRKGCNRGSGRAADPRQRRKRRGIARKSAAMPADDFLRGAMQ